MSGRGDPGRARMKTLDVDHEKPSSGAAVGPRDPDDPHRTFKMLEEEGGVAGSKESTFDVDHPDHGGLTAGQSRGKGDPHLSKRRGSHPDHRLDLPLRVHSGNLGHGREHWGARQRRVKSERRTVWALWPSSWRRREWSWPLEVTLVRRGPRPLDDDNLAAALKAVRDQVAKLLGVDDGDRSRVRFTYEQELGAAGVIVLIREAA